MTRRASWLIVASLLVVATATPVSAQSPASPETTPWTADALVARALEGHPALAVATAAAAVAAGHADQAGRWPNPRLAYSTENPTGLGEATEIEHAWRVDQPILLGGKLRLSRQALTHAVTAATADTAAARLRIGNLVRLRVIELSMAEAKLAVAERLVAYAETAEDIARQLQNTGLADAPDVLRAEAEAEAMRVHRLVAGTLRERAWQQLALAVGDPVLPRRAVVAESPTPASRDVALAAVLDQHPTLAAERAGIARASSELARARVERVPDLTVSAGPRHRSAAGERGQWTPTAGVSVGVPLWQRNPGGIAAAASQERQATASLAAAELDVRTRFESAWQRYTAAAATVTAYEDVIVPKATAAYEMSLARYREMALAYPLVLVAQQALLTASDALIDAVAARDRAAVALGGHLLIGEGEM